MVSADFIFTHNRLLLSIALVNWFASIFGASNSNHTGEYESTSWDVWSLGTTAGGEAYGIVVTSSSCTFNDGLSGMLTQVLSLFALVASFLPPLMGEWYVSLCSLFTLICWTVNWVGLQVGLYAVHWRCWKEQGTFHKGGAVTWGQQLSQSSCLILSW